MSTQSLYPLLVISLVLREIAIGFVVHAIPSWLGPCYIRSMLVLILLLNFINLTPSYAAAVNPSFVMDKKLFSPVPSKKTVCTFTINSSDEKNEFLKHLGTEKFNFVEMVPQDGKKQTEEDDSSQWFKDSCSTSIQCDIVVFSGHFGGSFFGSSGKKLSLETMQAEACAQTCKGILNAPKEVFLFGCNTLARKEKDARTPDQYRQILVEDGFTPDQADALAQTRYGDLGFDNATTMRSIFSNVPKIYGFSSIAPSGSHVQAMLDSYFNTAGSYESHLSSLSRSLKTSSKNNILMSALKNTSISETSGAQTSLNYANFGCVLTNPKMTTKEKVSRARLALQSNNRYSYLPGIERFIRENSDDEWVLGLKKELQSQIEIKDLVLKTLENSTSLSISYEFLKLARTFGYVSNTKLIELFKDRFLKRALVLPLSVERADLVASIDLGRFQTSLKIDDSELITKEHFADPEFRTALNIYFDSQSRGLVFIGDKSVLVAKDILANWKTNPLISISNAIWFLKQRNSSCDWEKPYPVLNEFLNSILDHTNDYKLALTVIEGKRYDNLPTPKSTLERVAQIMPEQLAEIESADEFYFENLIWIFYGYSGVWRRETGVVPRLDYLRENYTRYLKSHPELLKNSKIEYFSRILDIPFQMKK